MIFFSLAVKQNYTGKLFHADTIAGNPPSGVLNTPPS